MTYTPQNMSKVHLTVLFAGHLLNKFGLRWVCKTELNPITLGLVI